MNLRFYLVSSLVIVLELLNLSGRCQLPDTIGRYNYLRNDSLALHFGELKFESDLERGAFLVATDRPDGGFKAVATPLLLAQTPTFSSQLIAAHLAEVEAFMKQLDPKKLAQKSHEKQLTYLHGEIQERFLKKYEEIVNYSQIPEKGVFNCVTGTALYGMVFELAGIPVQIRETPNHVYLIAYPELERIAVETTEAETRIYLTEDYKKEYVKYLVENKMISEEEFNTKSIDTLFWEHTEKDSLIRPVELASLQYYNNAIKSFSKETFEEGITYVEKAYYLHPSEQIKAVLIEAYSETYKDGSFKDSTIAIRFVRVANALPKEYGSQRLSEIFGTIVYMYLVKDPGKVDHLRLLYPIFAQGLSDTVARNDVVFKYNASELLYNLDSLSYKNVVDHYIACKSIYPKHKLVNGDFKKLVGDKLIKNLEFVFSTEEEFENYPLDSMRFLLNDIKKNVTYKNINQIIVELDYINLFATSLLVKKCISVRRIDLAETYLTDFENSFNPEVFKKNSNVPVDMSEFSALYTLIMDYYLTGDPKTYKQAKRIGERGLKYFPKDKGILERMELADHYGK